VCSGGHLWIAEVPLDGILCLHLLGGRRCSVVRALIIGRSLREAGRPNASVACFCGGRSGAPDACALRLAAAPLFIDEGVCASAAAVVLLSSVGPWRENGKRSPDASGVLPPVFEHATRFGGWRVAG
jgi:hypothetical protein